MESDVINNGEVYTSEEHGLEAVGKGVSYAWMDKKVVMVMVSNTQPPAIGSVLRRQKDHSRTPIPGSGALERVQILF